MSSVQELDVDFFEKLLDGQSVTCYNNLQYAQVMAACREIRERYTFFRGKRCIGTSICGNNPWLVRVEREK